jgi:aspartyl protease family protein
VVATVALVAFLASRYPDAVSSQGDWANVTYLVALLALVSAGVVAGRRLDVPTAAKHAAAWVGVALLLVVGYSYRIEIGGIGERVLGQLLPHRGTVVDEGTVTFQAGNDGHFRVEAMVDGTSLRFLVDTGASDVVLSPTDARRLGFDLDRLAFSRFYATANGQVRGAPVRLREVKVGPILVSDVRASVNEADMGSSLLGMSFLGRLEYYEFRAGTLTLGRQN